MGDERAHAGIKNIYMYIRLSLSSSRSCGFAGAAHTYGTNLAKLFRNREIPSRGRLSPLKAPRKRVSLSKDLRDFEDAGRGARAEWPGKMGY